MCDAHGGRGAEGDGCTGTRVYSHPCAHTGTCMCTHTRATHTHKLTHTCVLMYTHAHVHTHPRARTLMQGTHSGMHTHTRTRLQATRAHSCTHTNPHEHTLTHSCTHSHTCAQGQHAQVNTRPWPRPSEVTQVHPAQFQAPPHSCPHMEATDTHLDAPRRATATARQVPSHPSLTFQGVGGPQDTDF